MAANPSNPHDAYFRNVLGRPAEAASELRLVLPREIVARLDWTTLEVQSGTFVSDELRSRQSDLLFRTKLDGHDAFVYILLEHQSRSDNLMPFRMLEYVVSIWNHYLRSQPDARLLPPIIPVVVRRPVRLPVDGTDGRSGADRCRCRHPGAARRLPAPVAVRAR
ncbi:Rpn family recombination-promoting nuclease/putative transposase [Nocardia sp. NPDC052112]|uniref:Rpn family recombination-promoting nuclease/putative transposase n=1 Tax=Nocardia sp. NPDC052112 TaxID=3155646 RepID=UPI00341317A5